MRYLFIAEKPSLMRDVKSCYANNKSVIQQKVGVIDFCALAGHVCADYLPNDYGLWADSKWEDIDYPIVPDNWRVKAIDGKQDLLKRIESAVKNYDGVIVGTDSDIEGYGIYRKLEQYLHLENMTALRFVEHSLTEHEILQSLLTMTDYHKDPIHVAATNAYLVRSRADWLFGMNCTRLMTIKRGTLLRVGRVKAATLGIVYDNSMAIEKFKPDKYYLVQADYGGFQADLLSSDRKIARFRECPNTSQYPLKGIVKEKKAKRVKEHAPKLFDLTAIQAEAGRLFHYSPSQTLDIVQSLYEKHKVISYPRTQCRFVSSEKAKEFPMMLQHMSVFRDLGEIVARVTDNDIRRVMKDRQVVNDEAVEQESHDALLPTSNRANPNAMTDDERNICHMIYARLLCQFLPEAEDDKTDLIIQHGEGEFAASGKRVIEQGWRILFRESKDVFLPELKEGDLITAKCIQPVQKTTTPPKRLTQATLINAMQNIASVIEDKELKKSLAESKGIGTPATRANIIKELFESRYMEDRKGGIYITELGKTYIESLDGIDIVSPVFAARLDMEMKKVQHGEESYEAAYAYVIQELKRLCTMMMALKQKKAVSTAKKYPANMAAETKYKCPYCGSSMMEQKFSYLCVNQECQFRVNKKIAGKSITPGILKTLADKKITGEYDFVNREGKKFRARLVLSGDKRITFQFASR